MCGCSVWLKGIISGCKLEFSSIKAGKMMIGKQVTFELFMALTFQKKLNFREGTLVFALFV